MIILKGLLTLLGRYVLFLGQVARRPGRWPVFLQRLVDEVWLLVVRSTWIVAVVSLFVGAVLTIELTYQAAHPLLPVFTIGVATRDMILLEFSSTVIALVLAGKVGGSIASEIGTMRITEQIDALEVMGVNSAAFLVLPKVTATVLFFPLLTIMSFIIGIIGGGAAGHLTGVIMAADFIEGIRSFFKPWYISFTLVKMSTYGFVIATVPAFWSYYVQGGSLEVGRASTRGVVDSSIAVLILNFIITQMFFG
ncbi:MAG: ABC transporter permease [Bacteroidia bacterium]|nr:MAG: ABC transporter permease [Bacteroidia bacterium]